MDPVVQTSAGRVRGRQAGTGWSFLGMPFARAPIGALRFAAPTPAPSWDGVRDAGQYGASAPQPPHDFTIIPEPIIDGDDCLNLNVFTPEVGDARLPVLVWIHGGGFVSGCNASPWYRGERFARNGIVVVSVNYRLGAEGFLALQGAPTNRGARDWICALQWVQENIGRFGGDPDQVTIAGQSAGGAACATLLAAGAAPGLFHRAVLMSGAAQLSVSPENADRFARRFADELGVPPTAEAFADVPAGRIREVQQKLAATRSDTAPDPLVVARRLSGGALRLAPWVDGDLLPAPPLERVAAGAGEDVPVLVGTTAEEFTMLANGNFSLDSTGLLEALGALGLSAPAARAYAGVGDGTAPSAVLAQAITDRLFRVPAVRLAEARAAAPANTYLYEFGWRSPALGGVLGAGHCLDIPFVFDNLDAEGVATVAGENPPQELADRMHAAWVRFVREGDPGWPPYLGQMAAEQGRRSTMLFGTSLSATDGGVVDDPLRDVRTAWEDALPAPG